MTNSQMILIENFLSSETFLLLSIRTRRRSCTEQNYMAVINSPLQTITTHSKVHCSSLTISFAVTPLCDLSVDLRKLPADAIQERNGSKGRYYRVDYDLGVTFGASGRLEFKFLYQGEVMGLVEYHYD